MHNIDLLQTYLIVVNVVTLALGALDARARRLRDRGISLPVLAAFSVLGGPLGILVSSFACDRKTRKQNVGQRFFAMWSLMAWGLALANIYGGYRLSIERFLESLAKDHTFLTAYLAGINVATFASFCVDKARARAGAWRIPEGTLLTLALMGGAAGGLLGMIIAHHKVRTPYFAVGLPLALALNVALVVFLMQMPW